MKAQLFLTSLIALIFVSCSTSPTGRKQVAFVPDEQIAQMGEQSFEKMKQEMEISKDENLNAYVRCIAKPVVEALDEGGNFSEWEVAVFKDDAANAFALPGKKIGVFTGIIDQAPTADHLAGVIGHEVGHVVADHSNERVSQTLLVQGGLTVADILAGKDSKTSQLTLAALGIGAQFGILLPYSRKHETEADEIGQSLMAVAGFNPEAAVEFWQIMQEKSRGAPPEFLSTHPSNASRIKALSENLDETIPLYEKAKAQGDTHNCERHLKK